jgi:hypothetical protein
MNEYLLVVVSKTPCVSFCHAKSIDIIERNMMQSHVIRKTSTRTYDSNLTFILEILNNYVEDPDYDIHKEEFR